MLELSKFSELVEMAPLLSLDLIIKTEQGFLLGKRKNEPAKGYWFVPGGRIHKNEAIDQAFKRIALKELNTELLLRDSKFIGVFEHFYGSSFVGKNISTHYVALGFQVIIKQGLNLLPFEEHSEYEYFSELELMNNEFVHKYTKQYFIDRGIL